VESRDEIGELARAFDKMVADLKHHVTALQRETAAREVVLSELRVAREIQTALLPKRLPAGAEFELQARNLAARHVAGDFYDAFQVAGDRVVFLVADVSGKGLPSALFMAVSRIVLRRALVESASPAAAVREVNESLVSESVGSMYLTLFVGFYEPATGKIRYVNAGHPLPWRVSASGKPSPFGEVTGGLVGLLPGMKFEEREEQLQQGDRLVVFTDGVPEARRGEEEFYGDERIAALLGDGPAEEAAGPLCDRIIAAVDAFQNGNLADDVTVLTLVRRS
jgi:sigma-B regulation protein RsbU (phosphoserine phosphatase)